MKRTLDIVFSLLGIILSLPICLLVALAIVLTSRGPAIFRQKRLGQGGESFRICKFRTMVVDQSDQACLVTEAGDHRITKIGAWLRRTKLDEIPQLFNVLRGEMSFVGPRPEVAEFASQFPQQYERILKVRPGITHTATIKFRREEEILAVAEDPCRYYIERVMPVKLAAYEAKLESSLAHDIQTVVQTIIPYFGETPLGPEDFVAAVPTLVAVVQSPRIENIPAFSDLTAVNEERVEAKVFREISAVGMSSRARPYLVG